MNERYLNLLGNQFAQARGIKNFDGRLEEFAEDFATWTCERSAIGDKYLSFIESLTDCPSISTSNTVEVGKGQFDSIAKPNGMLLITLFTEGIDQKQIYLPNSFIVFDGLPYSIEHLKENSNQMCLVGNGHMRFMTQNPYTPDSINGWEQLHNSGKNNITVGVFGNIHDKDIEQKIALMRNFRGGIISGGIVEDYTTDGDTYFYALSSTRKIKVRILTR